MLILKCETFSSEESLVDFVNQNDISRENILTITRTASTMDIVHLVLFYYAEGVIEKRVKIEIKEKKDTWF